MKKYSLAITLLGPEPHGLNVNFVRSTLSRSKMFNSRVEVNYISAFPSDDVVLYDEDLDVVAPQLDLNKLNILIVRSPIQDNFFIRVIDYDYSSDNWRNQKKRPIILLSTYEMDFIAKTYDVDLSHLVAITAWKFGVVFEFLLKGGKYFELYNSSVAEPSIFNFCKRKEEIIDCYRALKFGPRATAVFIKNYYNEEQVKALEKDLNRLKYSVLIRSKRWLERNQLASGILIGLLTGIIGTAIFEAIK